MTFMYWQFDYRGDKYRRYLSTLPCDSRRSIAGARRDARSEDAPAPAPDIRAHYRGDLSHNACQSPTHSMSRVGLPLIYCYFEDPRMSA